ncbi:MAG: tRNA pseudouridine(38-40) synthase TruA [Gammaproteobacteria bacterium]|nr:tRNA pseudouridine(38-40) synthase TruA [Gammaproteobacteria bacterium]MDH4315886.1 tRNA pseudouridine(38-40) synthase TruA [Gammaproteobacteria bacterium]MDH5213068.1 tRNA pseudouridine(38-40) synthase TruA [Gammaproteobacteria bacterium]MDH5500004.1 tRNA pseudouridine(38-40) synthase TruA [Gammaproteobacteria bacterium]
MRLALGIEYDGTAYNGWQRQKIGTGVQLLVEEALAAVANHPVDAVCAGRTDTGVHASGQVIHFDTKSARSTRSWLLGANSNLPSDINVSWVTVVDDDFHARFSALSRSYRYLILNREVRSALSRNRAWWIHHPIDVALMQGAAECLLGKHDFSAFRAAGCQASSPVREIHELRIVKTDQWISVHITANAFLQHMVRNIVGLLVAAGTGESPVARVREVLEGLDRRAGGVAAPAHGLTLVGVAYPDGFSLPAPATRLGSVPDNVYDVCL